jgi:hypothetical protein
MTEHVPDQALLPLRRPEGTGAGESPEFRQLAGQVFRTAEGATFIKIEVADRPEILPLQSKKLPQLLRFKSCKKTGKLMSPAEVRSTIDLLEAYALQYAPESEVHVRVALENGRAYIDLADDLGRVVEIGPEGWKVIETATVHFIHPASMRPLPVPEQGGTIDDLRSVINVADDDDFVLIVAFILDALRHDGGHPVLVINGAEGRAKSTLVEILRALIDPTSTPAAGLPLSERELLKAGQPYLSVFDNVSAISAKISDALCRLSTGSTAHPIIINGIGGMVARPDFADRGVFVNLELLPDHQRRSHQEIRATFNKLRPRILGVLFDAVAHGLRSLPSTQLDEKPRMADFALWATACEGALWPKGAFMTAYLGNRAEAAANLLDSDIVASAVRNLFCYRNTWSGTATMLDGILRARMKNIAGTNGWPAEPRILAIRLRLLAPSLSKVGIEVTLSLNGDRNRTRLITISERQHPVEPTDPSPPTGSAGTSDPEKGAADSS